MMLDVVRALSNTLVDGSADTRAIALEQTLRRLERPPRPDLADPFDWNGYAR